MLAAVADALAPALEHAERQRPSYGEFLAGLLKTVMAHADWIIDLGPGAGRIVFEATPADLVAARSTLTGEHLAAYVGT